MSTTAKCKKASNMSAASRFSLAKTGAFDELPPEHYQIYQYIHWKELAKGLTTLDTIDNIWISGPQCSGINKYTSITYTYCYFNYFIICYNLCISGKTKVAIERCKGAYYVKNISKWWDNYNYEDTVIIEELAPSLITNELAYLLKQWCDVFIVNVEIKGGCIRIRPKTIIVTSLYTVEECFKDHYAPSMAYRFPCQVLLADPPSSILTPYTG